MFSVLLGVVEEQVQPRALLHRRSLPTRGDPVLAVTGQPWRVPVC